ncbi:hypothetical protein F4802DRAFT_445564 [Xylaria palmicola]|nr:hypothetical protein F4802DRAFT_445564 [Xylaria palmicola]
MTNRRSMIFGRRPLSVGLSSRYSGGPPLSQVNGKSLQAGKEQEVKASASTMTRGSDLSYDPITAPPESSGDEAENTSTTKTASNDGHDSDDEYDKGRTADIRSTTFTRRASSTTNDTRLSRSKSSASRGYNSGIDGSSSLTGSKRPAEEYRPKEANPLDRELESPRQRKKKRQVLTRYGSQHRSQEQNASQQPTSSASKGGPTSSASRDSSEYMYGRRV